MPWLRLWVDILDDPDLDALPKDTCWAWTRLLAVAKRNDPQGQIPEAKRLSLILREPLTTVHRYVRELLAAGMLDDVNGTLHVHGWHRWQPKEPMTNAERQAKFRKSKKQTPSPQTPLSPEEKRGEEKSNVTPLLSVTDATAGNGVTGVGRAVVPVPDPEIDRVSRLAEELSGDVSWRIWAEQQHRLGHPARAVEESLRVCVDSGKWDRRFAAGVLKRLASEGYPTAPKQINGRHRPNEPQVNQPASAMNPPAGLETFAAESAVLMAKYEAQQQQRRKSS